MNVKHSIYDPTRAYLPDLVRPLLIYRYSGEALCGLVAVPFIYETTRRGVEAFTDLRNDRRWVKLIPEPTEGRAALGVWVEALSVMLDLRDLERERRDADAARLYTQASDTIEARVNALGRQVYAATSSRRYGS